MKQIIEFIDMTQKYNDSRFIYYYAKFMIVIGTLGQALFYLQAFKIYQKGCADNVSLEGFIVAFISLISWLGYGFLIRDKVLIIVNSFAAIGAFLTLLAIFLV